MSPHLLIRKGWFFWQVVWADEPVGEFDSPTIYRSRTRDGAIAKARRQLRVVDRWEHITVPVLHVEEDRL